MISYIISNYNHLITFIVFIIFSEAYGVNGMIVFNFNINLQILINKRRILVLLQKINNVIQSNRLIVRELVFANWLAVGQSDSKKNINYDYKGSS